MMVRHFSHEVADLQPALEMLKAQDIEDHGVGICTKNYGFQIKILFLPNFSVYFAFHGNNIMWRFCRLGRVVMC